MAMSPLRTLAAAIVLGLLLALAALSGGAGAQTYPPPVGSLLFTASSTTPRVGSPVTLTTKLLDNKGLPIANAAVLFHITHQSASDATLEGGVNEVTKMTDSQGAASVLLNPGAHPQTIIVEALSADKTSQLTLTVQAAGGLPSTGGSPPDESGGMAPWQAALIAAGAAMLLSGTVIVVRKWRR
jgi:hypothetical protein